MPGAAVIGEAARLLTADAGIEADTVAMLLARSEAGTWVVDARTVLIVDEASTLGDRDLLRLYDMAAECRATPRLIGDTARHGPDPAGAASLSCSAGHLSTRDRIRRSEEILNQ